jgi:hypothetical protein
LILDDKTDLIVSSPPDKISLNHPDGHRHHPRSWQVRAELVYMLAPEDKYEVLRTLGYLNDLFAV